MIHTSNSFMKDDNTFVVDAAIYQKDVNVYEMFEMNEMRKNDNLLGKDFGGVFKRFEIDLTTKKVTTTDLAKMVYGNYDLPMYNDEFDGVKENCITYIVGMFEHQVLDSNYSFDIKKFNGCKKEFESIWSEPGYLPNEPWFVRNPNG